MNILSILLGIFGASVILGTLVYNVKSVVDKIKQKKEKKENGNHDNDC